MPLIHIDELSLSAQEGNALPSQNIGGVYIYTVYIEYIYSIHVRFSPLEYIKPSDGVMENLLRYSTWLMIAFTCLKNNSLERSLEPMSLEPTCMDPIRLKSQDFEVEST